MSNYEKLGVEFTEKELNDGISKIDKDMDGFISRKD
jgi:hypothetical protein